MSVFSSLVSFVSAPFTDTEEEKRAETRRLIDEVRAFNASSTIERHSDWPQSSDHLNTLVSNKLPTLMARSRHHYYNDPHARKAINSLVSEILNTGVKGKVSYTDGSAIDDALKTMQNVYTVYADSVHCDFNKRTNMIGLQDLGVRTIVMSGSCLVYKRKRANPMYRGIQLPPVSFQILEPDFLATDNDGYGSDGSSIVNGVHYDSEGTIVKYYIYSSNPLDSNLTPKIIEVSPEDLKICCKLEQPGQTLGIPWLAPILTRLKDFNRFSDAFLYRQLLANAHAAFVTGNDPKETLYEDNLAKKIEPGAVTILPLGTEVVFNNPPKAEGSEEFRRETKREFATGTGTTYEAISGDYSDVNFSSGRLASIDSGIAIRLIRSSMVTPQFLDFIGESFLEAYGIIQATDNVCIKWRYLPKPLSEPHREIPPLISQVRAGLISPQEAIARLGGEPDEIIAEWTEFMKLIDEAGLVFDIDARKTTTSGRPIEPSESDLSGKTGVENNE